MSTAAEIITLPRLLAHRPGETFDVPLTWADHLADGETVAAATTEIERSPPDAPDIVEATTHSTTTSSIRFAVPADAAPGRYHVRHVVQTSLGLRYRECFTILVEEC